MDVVRTRLWNERTDNKEPTRLIDVKDGGSIAALFRGMKASEDKE